MFAKINFAGLPQRDYCLNCDEVVMVDLGHCFQVARRVNGRTPAESGQCRSRGTTSSG
jgi:hypothetical protein